MRDEMLENISGKCWGKQPGTYTQQAHHQSHPHPSTHRHTQESPFCTKTVFSFLCSVPFLGLWSKMQKRFTKKIIICPQLLTEQNLPRCNRNKPWSKLCASRYTLWLETQALLIGERNMLQRERQVPAGSTCFREKDKKCDFLQFAYVGRALGRRATRHQPHEPKPVCQEGKSG